MFTELPSRGPRARSGAWCRLGVALSALVLASLPVLAHAQEDPARDDSGDERAVDPDSVVPDERSDAEEPRNPNEPPPGVERIVIRGSSAPETGVEAPTFTTSFDAWELEALGVANVADLAAVTPSLEIRTASGTTYARWPTAYSGRETCRAAARGAPRLCRSWLYS